MFLAALDEPRLGELAHASSCLLINVSTGQDLMIRELADTIDNVLGHRSELTHDRSNPDGTLRKVMDVSRINAMGCGALRGDRAPEWPRHTAIFCAVKWAAKLRQRRLLASRGASAGRVPATSP